MKRGIQIFDNKINYKAHKVGEVPLNCIFKSFQIEIPSVKIICLSPRLSGETESLIISFVDKNLKLYKFSEYDLGRKSLQEIRKIFKFKSWEFPALDKFYWDDHENSFVDKIIFPNELYWMDLFEPPNRLTKSILRWGKFFGLAPIVSGKFNKKVIKYIKTKKNDT